MERQKISCEKLNENRRSKAPVVFIHGAMCDRTVWRDLARELADMMQDRAFHLLDLPGHGEAGGRGCDRIEDHAAFVCGFMKGAGLSKAVLVGHSMGGAIAQQIAIDRPEMAVRLILLATGARLGVSPQIINALRDDFDFAVAMIKDFSFAQNVPEKIYGPVLKVMASTAADVSIADFSACSAFDSVGRIEKLDLPAIVCCGEKDLLTSTKKNRRLAESLGCDYIELENTGHMLQVERPVELGKIIASFLARDFKAAK